MCISRREPTPCGGGVSYAHPSCPGHHVHVDGSSLIAANTVSCEAGTVASNMNRCGDDSRKSSSTVRKRWAMTHNVDFLHRRRGEENGDRVRIKEYDGLVTGDITTRAFYLTYLLHIFFDVQALGRGG